MFAVKVFHRIHEFSLKYHVVRGMAAYATIWPAGCLLQQALNGDERFDFGRAIRFSLYGCFYQAPTFSAWLIIAKTLWPRVLVRVAVEQISYTPFAMVSFHFLMTLFEGRTLMEAKNEVRTKFLPTYQVGLMVWPVAQMLNYTYVPERNRVPFVSACSLLWTLFLAHMNRKAEPEIAQFFIEVILNVGLRFLSCLVKVSLFREAARMAHLLLTQQTYVDVLTQMLRAGETAKPRTADEHLEYANKLIDSNQYQDALAYISRAIEIDPSSSWYFKQRAICHANLNHSEQVKMDLTTIREMDEEDKDIEAIRLLQNMAMPHSDNWRPEEEFNQKLGDPLTTPAELTKLGHELFYMRKYDQALKFHDAALRKEGNIAEYFRNRALCYAMLRRHLYKVRSDLLMAKTLNPNDKQLRTIWRLAVLNDAGRTTSDAIQLWEWPDDEPVAIIEDHFSEEQAQSK